MLLKNRLIVLAGLGLSMGAFGYQQQQQGSLVPGFNNGMYPGMGMYGPQQNFATQQANQQIEQKANELEAKAQALESGEFKTLVTQIGEKKKNWKKLEQDAVRASLKSLLEDDKEKEDKRDARFQSALAMYDAADEIQVVPDKSQDELDHYKEFVTAKQFQLEKLKEVANNVKLLVKTKKEDLDRRELSVDAAQYLNHVQSGIVNNVNSQQSSEPVIEQATAKAIASPDPAVVASPTFKENVQSIMKPLYYNGGEQNTQGAPQADPYDNAGFNAHADKGINI
ncbi:hypothetical protein K2X33_09475 [bacterium]|nr:hypothetical protein [bacterium]